jgi:hypothetical protein
MCVRSEIATHTCVCHLRLPLSDTPLQRKNVWTPYFGLFFFCARIWRAAIVRCFEPHHVRILKCWSTFWNKNSGPLDKKLTAIVTVKKSRRCGWKCICGVYCVPDDKTPACVNTYFCSRLHRYTPIIQMTAYESWRYFRVNNFSFFCGWAKRRDNCARTRFTHTVRMG